MGVPPAGDTAPHAPSPDPLPEIDEGLAGGRLLLTGATGFVGRALVEKLLRCAPSLERLYLLVRPGPDGESPRERARSAILGSPVFDRLRRESHERLEESWRDAVRVIPGELAAPGMGLEEDLRRKLEGGLDAVLHAGATVRFTERLDRALDVNVRGAERALELARRAGAAFLQVSTCYVAGRRGGEIHEALLATPREGKVDPGEVLAEAREACEGARGRGPGGRTSGAKGFRGRSSDEGVPAGGPVGGAASATARGPELVRAGAALARKHGWCDTYSLTKWLAEHAVARAASEVPLTIVRPSIIESSLREPEPGWIDGRGPLDPLILEYGRGRLRHFPTGEETVLDVVPVDLVVNAILLSVLDLLGGRPPGAPLVCHVGSSARNPLRIGRLAETAYRFFSSRPLRDSDGHPISVEPFRFTGPGSFGEGPPSRGSGASSGSSSGPGSEPGSGPGSGPEARARSGGGSRASPAPGRRGRSRRLALFRAFAGYVEGDHHFRDDTLRRLAARVHPRDRERLSCDVTEIDWCEYLATHIAALVGSEAEKG